MLALVLLLAMAPDLEWPQLIYRVKPEHPAIAKAARIEGTVRLTAWIDKRGAVARLQLVSGHPFLVKAAMDAAKQWRYRPMYVMGVPMATRVAISIGFSLAGGEERGPVVYVATPRRSARSALHSWSCRL